MAPPDLHMLVHRGFVELARGPLENGHRPAIDPLFRTAAQAYGPALIAVVLSGNLDDGSAGAQIVAGRGGTVVAQDPDDALYGEMPRNAIEATAPDNRVLPIADLGAEIARLVAQGPAAAGYEPNVVPDPVEQEPGAIERQLDGLESTFTCPNCSGPLREDGEPDDVLHFRCRVGHAWSFQSLLSEQGSDLENSLWGAIRVLQERVVLSHRLRDRARARGNTRTADRFDAQAREAEQQAQKLRALFSEAADVQREEPVPGL